MFFFDLNYLWSTQSINEVDFFISLGQLKQNMNLVI